MMWGCMQWRACTQCNIGLAYCHLFAIIVNYYTILSIAGIIRCTVYLKDTDSDFCIIAQRSQRSFWKCAQMGFAGIPCDQWSWASIKNFDMQSRYRLDAWNLCALGVLWWQILGVLRWQMRTAASKQQNSFCRGSDDRQQWDSKIFDFRHSETCLFLASPRLVYIWYAKIVSCDFKTLGSCDGRSGRGLCTKWKLGNFEFPVIQNEALHAAMMLPNSGFKVKNLCPQAMTTPSDCGMWGNSAQRRSWK